MTVSKEKGKIQAKNADNCEPAVLTGESANSLKFQFSISLAPSAQK